MLLTNNLDGNKSDLCLSEYEVHTANSMRQKCTIQGDLQAINRWTKRSSLNAKLIQRDKFSICICICIYIYMHVYVYVYIKSTTRHLKFSYISILQILYGLTMKRKV